MLSFKKMKIKQIQNEKADYGFIEVKEYVDFEPKRIYYVHYCKEATGQHCHKIEEELFVVQKGSCIAIIDQGKGKEDIEMIQGDAIYVGNYVWHGFKNFSPDAVLLAISSTNYSPDRSDYVEDYEEYLKVRDVM